MKGWEKWIAIIIVLLFFFLLGGWYHMFTKDHKKSPFQLPVQETEENIFSSPFRISTKEKLKESNQTDDNITIPVPMPTIEELLKQLSLPLPAQNKVDKGQCSVTQIKEIPLQVRLQSLDIPMGTPVFIRIFKQEKLLEVWMPQIDGEYAHVKDYEICAYSGYLGPKIKEGDKQAPEGFYRVFRKQLNPNSRFHLAFNLGYPNAYDRAHHRTGSYLMVHGKCASIGCYAMTDKRIDEIYTLVEAALNNGQAYVPVHIFPFRMEAQNINRYTQNRWYPFWLKLKEGYDYFEAERRPPRVEVQDGDYVILESEEPQE